MSQSMSTAVKASGLMPSAEQRTKLRRWRNIKDKISGYGIMTAGIAVVGSLALIFVYLFSEVTPLLRGASVDVEKSYSLPSLESSPAEFISLERYEEIGTSYHKSGTVQFFNAIDGSPLSHQQVPKSADAEFTTLAASESSHGLVAYGYSNGEVAIVGYSGTSGYGTGGIKCQGAASSNSSSAGIGIGTTECHCSSGGFIKPNCAA